MRNIFYKMLIVQSVSVFLCTFVIKNSLNSSETQFNSEKSQRDSATKSDIDRNNETPGENAEKPVITSDKMKIFIKEEATEFRDNVKFKQGKNTLFADILLHYERQGIVKATGNVHLVSEEGERKIDFYAGEIEFFEHDGNFYAHENVRISQEGNLIWSERTWYDGEQKQVFLWEGCPRLFWVDEKTEAIYSAENIVICLKDNLLKLKGNVNLELVMKR